MKYLGAVAGLLFELALFEIFLIRGSLLRI